MEFIGYVGAMIIGVSLGLIGGGGSILTVPVLVYLFQINAVVATAYSLFIVGITSLGGSYTYFKKGLINLKTALVFGLPSIVAVFLTRKYLIPAIPDHLFEINEIIISKDIFLLLVFAILMIAASYSMIKKPKLKVEGNGEVQEFNYALIFLEGIIVGALTGLVGAGGGFLIIPALVILSKLPMKEAIGTSLLIIAAKSLIGFTGEIGTLAIDWKFILVFSSISLLGMAIGISISNKVDGNKLKPAFGWFVLIMGLFIIVKELYLK